MIHTDFLATTKSNLSFPKPPLSKRPDIFRVPHVRVSMALCRFYGRNKAQDHSPYTHGGSKNVSSPVCVSLKEGCLRRQAINLAPQEMVRVWGDGSLRFKERRVIWMLASQNPCQTALTDFHRNPRHTRPYPCINHHGRPKCISVQWARLELNTKPVLKKKDLVFSLDWWETDKYATLNFEWRNSGEKSRMIHTDFLATTEFKLNLAFVKLLSVLTD